MKPLPHSRAVWIAKNILLHEPALRAWLKRKVRPPLEIDDIVQEAYAVFGALDSVEHIRAPRNYLFQTAQNLMAAQLRRARVVPFEALSETFSDSFADEAPSPEREAIARQELRRIQALIHALPAQQRQAFELFKVLGLSQREIGQRMGISQSTVEKHLSKAVRTLMDAMRTGGYSDPEASRGFETQEFVRYGPEEDEFRHR